MIKIINAKRELLQWVLVIAMVFGAVVVWRIVPSTPAAHAQEFHADPQVLVETPPCN